MADDSPKFFKVILAPTEGFMIPKAFTRHYRETLENNTLLLKVPSGATWPVGLVYKDGEAWVQNGWKDFAEHYSIQLGYFLLFTYQGSSRFFVTILDGTHSEIDYPANRPSLHARVNFRQQNWEPQHDVSFETSETEEEDHVSVESETVDSEDDVSFETSDTEDEDFSVETLESEDDVTIETVKEKRTQMRQGKRADRDRKYWARNHFKRADLNDEDLGVRRGRLGHGKPKVLYPSSSKEEERWEEKGRGWQSKKRKKQASIYGERSPPYQTRECSRAKNKSFTCIIREAYITKSCIMHCPFDFARSHFPTTVYGRPTRIEVVDPIGERWEVMYAMRGHRPQWTGPGWRAMVRKNKLNVGDVCEFEQVQKSVFLLRIIYRKTN